MMKSLRELDVKRLVVATLIVPLLLFSFLSVHTMPRFTAQGLKEQIVFPEISYDDVDEIRGMDIIICTGTGVETLSAVDDDDPADTLTHSPCDWSMQGHAATLPATGIALEPLALGHTEAFAFEKTILRSGKINPGRHARAPPLSV